MIEVKIRLHKTTHDRLRQQARSTATTIPALIVALVEGTSMLLPPIEDIPLRTLRAVAGLLDTGTPDEEIAERLHLESGQVDAARRELERMAGIVAASSP